MNRNKQYIYNFKENAPKPKSIDLWLNKYKPRETTMIETYKKCYYVVDKPKHRHIRSIVIRNLKKLRGRIDYYAHQYRKPHRVTIITKPTWEWYLGWRAK